MRIGVIGTGNMGSGLGRQLARAGHEVFMGSRDPLKGKEAGVDIGASGGSYQEAADHGEVVVLAVPWWGVDEALASSGDLSGKVLVDITNPYKDETYSEMVEFTGTSGAEEVAKRASGARVVKGWNHIFAPIVNSSPDFEGRPASVFLAGDDAEAKEKVIGLARDLGFDPVDAGPLSSARFIEPLAGLMIWMAYGLGRGTDQAVSLLKR